MRDTKSDVVFNWVNTIILWFALIVTLYPLIYILSSSFSDAKAVVSGRVWLFPVDFNTDAYKGIFESKQIYTGYYNSFIYMVLGTIVNIIVTILAAYPLSRKDFLARNPIMVLFTFTMLFNGGLIPTYLVIKQINLLNTIWAMVLPGALSVWNVVLMRTYLQNSIPHDLLEAAQLDGCRDFQYLIRIVLPLSGPILAVLVLFFAVGHWNSYFNALIYLSSPDMFPLQIILRNILIQNDFDPQMMKNIDMREMARLQNMKDLMKYALIVVASVPVLAIYPFVQKYFIRGIMIGALKG